MSLILTSLVPLALTILLFAPPCKRKRLIYNDIHNVSSQSIFDKVHSNVLKGFASIIVIFVHVPAAYGNGIQDAIGSFGYVAVTYFFMMSAYGMRRASIYNSQYITHFWRGRLAALLIPMFLCNVVYFRVDIISSDVLGVSKLYNFNGYVVVLLAYCLWFYAVLQITKNRLSQFHIDWMLILGVVVSSIVCYVYMPGETSNMKYWCFEQYGLVWGILLCRFEARFLSWIHNRRFLKVIVLILLGAVLGIGYLKFKAVPFWGEYVLKIVLGAELLILVFTLLDGFIKENCVTRFLGNISYETYLLHGVSFSLLAMVDNLQSGVFILLAVGCTLAMAVFVKFIATPLVKAIRSLGSTGC